jgi:hypothetical protein
MTTTAWSSKQLEDSVMIVNTFSVTQSGDIGGTGLGRFHVLGDGVAPMTNTQLNAVATAITGFYTAIHTNLPSTVTWIMSPVSQVVTVETGALTADQNIPVVPTITAGLLGNYVAGTGSRVYWHTVTIKNRRLIRGALFVAPMVAAAFGNNGALVPSTATAIQTAATAYIAAINAATLVPVVYSRPTRTLPSSGTVGNIVSATVSVKPCSVRSRRS